MASVSSTERETVIDDDTSIAPATTVPFAFPPLPSRPAPPFSSDPALLNYKYTNAKGIVYQFREKSALKRSKNPSWIWRYGSELARDRHLESTFWSCDLCWDKRKGKLPDRVEIT
jgi:hypothetical protein